MVQPPKNAALANEQIDITFNHRFFRALRWAKKNASNENEMLALYLHVNAMLFGEFQYGVIAVAYTHFYVLFVWTVVNFMNSIRFTFIYQIKFDVVPVMASPLSKIYSGKFRMSIDWFICIGQNKSNNEFMYGNRETNLFSILEYE